jgi:hypothetical protein
MQQRGRKSIASLSVVADIAGRPQPPAELTEFEAALWQKVTATKPSDWFTADCHQLLIAYCRHASQAAVIDQQIAAFEPVWLAEREGLERYGKLIDIRAKCSGMLNSLSRAMRLTQQSRYGAVKAETHSNRAKTARKPWEK